MCSLFVKHLTQSASWKHNSHVCTASIVSDIRTAKLWFSVRVLMQAFRIHACGKHVAEVARVPRRCACREHIKIFSDSFTRISCCDILEEVFPCSKSERNLRPPGEERSITRPPQQTTNSIDRDRLKYESEGNE